MKISGSDRWYSWEEIERLLKISANREILAGSLVLFLIGGLFGVAVSGWALAILSVSFFAVASFFYRKEGRKATEILEGGKDDVEPNA